MRKHWLILLLVLLGALSCKHEEMPAGSLRIVFETEAPETKAEGDGVVEDGGGIYLSGSGTELDPYHHPDLVILLADASGSIVGKFNGLSDANVRSQLEGTPTSTRIAVSISGTVSNTDLTAGATYTVYAFANTQGFWTMKSGGSTVASLTDDLYTAEQIEALQFYPVGGDLDSYDCLKVEDRLPLSAKGTVTLSGNKNGEISLDMLRCVAKVTAVFDNQYGDDLTLSDFSNTFTHMNPSTGYVIPHTNDFPVAQGSAYDGDISASEKDDISIEDDDYIEISWYVLPSIGPYTTDISFKLSGEPYTYTNLPVHDDHARDIPQLARNQHLTITTRIGKGKKVSFNFKVEDWDTKTESVYFD